ncbi:MAG: PINc/VapC family ATPase [Halobacteriales archaeon]
MKLVPDTSAVIDGRVSAGVDAGEFDDAAVLVPEAVVAELESQANAGVDTGWDGLAELQRLAGLAEEGAITVEYTGRRPTGSEREEAASGEVDALIRDLAETESATVLTSDQVQSEVARAKGLDVEYVEPDVETVERLAIEDFFDPDTMSVHLRAGAPPMAKRGEVGEMTFEAVRERVSTEDELEEWAAEIEAAAAASPEGFVELQEEGMRIVQFREFRIAIARPPFADGWEITAVRPIVETDLADYEHADDLRGRLLEEKRGVLIAGSPGAGKTTFAQAVAEFLADNDNAVKTMEKPRDLQVGPEITQYTELGGSMETTADSLLMVRPDYTIYDEVRKTDDFEVFSDMRLAGVGMIGVVHATRAIDALQRLIGRVELGLIPQIVDTVIYIEAGEVRKVYDVRTEVKVPQGLTEEDLARPVIMISEFETGVPEYEIYTFNRQVVTVPLTGDDAPDESESGTERLARQEVESEIRSIAHGHVEVEFASQDRAIVYVDDDDISAVIGKGGGRISDIEDRLGIDIDVRTHEERPTGRGQTGRNDPESPAVPDAVADTGNGAIVAPDITGNHVVIPVDGYVGETVEVQAGEEYLFTATVGHGGEIQVSRGSAIAEELEAAIDQRRPIKVVPT